MSHRSKEGAQTEPGVVLKETDLNGFAGGLLLQWSQMCHGEGWGLSASRTTCALENDDDAYGATQINLPFD